VQYRHVVSQARSTIYRCQDLMHSFVHMAQLTMTEYRILHSQHTPPPTTLQSQATPTKTPCPSPLPPSVLLLQCGMGF
jgi:hypothetical protein